MSIISKKKRVLHIFMFSLSRIYPKKKILFMELQQCLIVMSSRAMKNRNITQILKHDFLETTFFIF